MPLLASSIPGHAADLPYKAPPPFDPPFSWTGFYIGAHVGAGWGTKEFDYNDLTPAAPFLWNAAIPVNGAVAGGQIGYNIQAGWAVFGVEADGSWADITGKGLCNTTVFFLNCNAKTSGLATVTGRIGATMDRTLVYVKGGGAWERSSDTISNVALPPLGTSFSSQITNTRTGWTIGMGLEYAFMAHWSARLEYDYMDFGTQRYNFPATSLLVPANTFTNWDLVNRIHTVTAGINYHF